MPPLRQPLVGLLVAGLECANRRQGLFIHVMTGEFDQLLLHPGMSADSITTFDVLELLRHPERVETFAAGSDALFFSGKFLQNLRQFLVGQIVPAGLNQEAIDAKVVAGIRRAAFVFQSGMPTEQPAHRGRVKFAG